MVWYKVPTEWDENGNPIAWGIEEVEDDTDEYEDIYDPDYVPVGCRACGGPYPNCKWSCNLFDE